VKVIREGAVAPRLVVTITTVLASSPYTDAEEASFSTEMEAISLGSISEMLRSMPSTMYLAEEPRTMMLEPSEPGCPDCWREITPETTPPSMLVMFPVGRLRSSSPPIALTAPVMLPRFWVP